jgi:hypothetical protein
MHCKESDRGIGNEVRTMVVGSLSRFKGAGVPKRCIGEGGEIWKAGIPAVSDHIVQVMVKMYLEPKVEPSFQPDSYCEIYGFVGMRHRLTKMRIVS